MNQIFAYLKVKNVKYFSFLLLLFGTTWFVREPDVHICYPLNHIFGENNIQAYTKKLPFLEVDSWC